MRLASIALCLLALTVAAPAKELKKAHGFDISSARGTNVKFVYFIFTDPVTGEVTEKKAQAKKGLKNALNKAIDSPAELADMQCVIDLRFEMEDGTTVYSPDTDICSTDELLIE